MGSSGKWIKSLISAKKIQSCEQEKGSGKSRKWKLWRSASGGLRRSGGRMAESEGYESSCCSGAFEGSMAAAMATVVRAPHKDFEMIRREWAATRIQTAFRAFLARRAFRALRAVVRLQAIFRGRRIRKQAAVTLKCMQALVRVQDRVRANNIQTALDNQALKESSKSDPIKEAENGWCNNRGTVQEVRSKIQMKQEGVVKRVRAIAYAEAQQLRRKATTPKKMVSSGNVIKRGNHGMSWLEGWMANKPWESRLMEDYQTSSADMTPVSSRKYKSESTPESLPHSSEHVSVQIRRNNISTRISARPSVTDRLSEPSSEGLCDESTSSSSLSTSGTPASNKTPMPSFMKATASIKAKQRGAPQWCSVDSSQIHQKQTSSFSGTLNRRSADSDLYSVKLCKDLYPLGKYDCFRS